MSLPQKPQAVPARAEFSSGPCPKRPGWSAETVAGKAFLGRSHRAAGPKAQIKDVIDRTAKLLDLPEGYVCGIVPASDTGAFEMAMWSLLGPKPVDMLVWESFGKGWATDATKQLKLDDCRVLEADYGQIPDLADVRDDADVCFTWNGTTSGAKVPNGDWIADNADRLVLCDATSAVFAQDVEIAKLDVVTFSWQKVLGGEGAHGVIILSPRAIARLESFTPDRPLPKIFRMTKGGALIADIFTGATINTPSMWAVADCLDALEWVEEIGGLDAVKARANENAKVLQDWVDQTDWIENLVADPAARSNTSVCLKIVDPVIASMDDAAQAKLAKQLVKTLDSEGVAYDIGSYRDAPAGLRIWCGATVDAADLKALTPWLDWAFATLKADL
ncbi:phosphoserine transaminase [Paracoccaceae bacterium GXU_MW_L88]